MNHFVSYFYKLGFILSLVLLSSFQIAHPLKMSSGLIREIPDGLFVRVKLFSDDFQDRLNALSKRKIEFSNGLQAHENKSIQAYLNNHLQFRLRNETLSFNKVKSTLIEEKLLLSVEFYLLFTHESDLDSLEIKNNLMVEVFSNQRNIMMVNTKNFSKRLDFTSDNQIQKIPL